LRSHTLISSLSEEQRASSNGWKSSDLTGPLCPSKVDTNLTGYIHIYISWNINKNESIHNLQRKTNAEEWVEGDKNIKRLTMFASHNFTVLSVEDVANIVDPAWNLTSKM
jgi:hypothetical protein